MDLLDRLAALSDIPYQMRPPRRDSLPDQLWRTLRQIAQWLLISAGAPVALRGSVAHTVLHMRWSEQA